MSDLDLNSRLFLTLDEASQLLLINRRTLEREIVRGRFPKPLKVGGSLRVPVPAFVAYLRSLCDPTARDPFISTFSGPTYQDMEVLDLIQRLTGKTPPLRPYESQHKKAPDLQP